MLARSPCTWLIAAVSACAVFGLALGIARSDGDKDHSPPPPPAAVLDLTVFYTSDLLGEMEPCGCTEGQLGGLARRATVIRQALGRGENVLVLDSGDAFFRREAIPDILRPQLKLKARRIAEADDRLGCLGGLGETDLTLGVEEFKALGAVTVAANAREVLGPRGLSSTTKEFAGWHVAVAGVTSPTLCGDAGKGMPDPVRALSDIVPGKAGADDLFLCVSHLGLDGDKALAAAVPSLDVIVGGHDDLSIELPARVGRTLIVQANRQGRFLGRLRLHLHRGWRGADLFDASENERWRELAVEYDAAVARFARERDTARTPGDRERAQANVDLYTREAAEARGKVRDLSDKSWFANRLLPLDAHIQDDPDVAKLVSLYKEEAKRVNEALAASLAAEPREGPACLGSAACVKCHAAESESWSKTPHAHAFEVLARRRQEMDLECIGCHTTAFQEKGGFFLPSKVGDWKGVQCEACHGPGEGHPDRKMVLAAPREICTRCHQPPQQEHFDYETALPKTRHPK